MVEYTTGNILDADAEALVNAVNCVGVMGKGVALQFKEAYRNNFVQYKQACTMGKVQPGQMFITETGNVSNPRYIINFPTKRHWRAKSRSVDIENGLRSLVADIQQLNISSIAIPALGCGNGGLNWDEIRQQIEVAVSSLSDVRIILYEPRYETNG